jgi:hypothetical protein
LNLEKAQAAMLEPFVFKYRTLSGKNCLRRNASLTNNFILQEKLGSLKTPE